MHTAILTVIAFLMLSQYAEAWQKSEGKNPKLQRQNSIDLDEQDSKSGDHETTQEAEALYNFRELKPLMMRRSMQSRLECIINLRSFELCRNLL
ncbi:unnamed protein product [Caenorhabditis auriculariae]|uniref:Uncharacterized protein n=1 Tax=Caenorhabditis auriculariae TaxID=2777116 RepID=A0A8S1HMP9_9PELO|nr:unnamed protein product [Caenorhabditis auriculariae]